MFPENTSNPAPLLSPDATALCIGHPGHEIQVLEWMHLVKPLVDVITDGSGPDRPSRFHYTKDLLDQAGARLGVFQGGYPDRYFYDLILKKSPTPFLEMAERLANEWVAHQIRTVAGDMMEGFSPTHDLCRIMINAAVIRAERRMGIKIVNLQFALDRMTITSSPQNAVLVHLSDEQFSRKRQVVLQAYPAVASEANRLIAKYGEATFKVETLVPAEGSEGLTWTESEPPFYETYGRKQIALGHYRDLITYSEHIRPLAEALYLWAEN